MNRVPLLIQKLAEINKQTNGQSMIDLDLMLDYTRVLYADLLEMRKQLQAASFNQLQAILSFENSASTEQKAEKQTVLPTLNPNNFSKNNATTVPTETVASPTLETPIKEPAKEEIVEKVAVPEKIILELPKTEEPSKEIRQLIGINEKFLFLNELFSNNYSAYESTLNQINKLETLKDAQDWLSANVYPAYAWDDTKESVQMFVDTLSSFYALH